MVTCQFFGEILKNNKQGKIKANTPPKSCHSE